jgi:hypothetical protein
MAALAIVWGSAASPAEEHTGILAGAVVDSTGAAVGGAQITVKAPGAQASRVAISNDEGKFTLSELQPAVYDITVNRTGFRPLLEHQVRVDVDRTNTIELRLEVGPASQTLEVDSKTAGLDVEDAKIESLLDLMELTEIIQDTRTITDLGYFGPGVARRAAGGLGSGFVIGGARADSTNFLLDGLNDHDPRTGGTEVMPNYDAIEEFRVQTTGEAAEYGRMAGGVMTVVLRSGTNQVHGTLFEFARTSALGARNFFDIQKSELLRNQAGATLSGPITLPGIYNGRDRTFFLVSWEGLFQAQGTYQYSNVPTAAEQAGNFSASVTTAGQPVTINDPLTGKPFPQDHIPQTRFDAIAQNLAPYYPLPNRTDPLTNYASYQVAGSRYHSAVARVDEHVSDANILSLRYLTRISAGTSPYSGSALGTFGSRNFNQPMLTGLEDTHTFSASVVNEFRAGLTRYAERDASARSAVNGNNLIGLPGPGASNLYGFPSFSILNLANLGDSSSLPVNITINTYDAGDALSWTHGRHMFKFGADTLRTQFFQQLDSNSRGSYNFLGRWTSDAWADFLLGLPDSTTRQTTSTTTYLFSTDLGFFAQDEFRVSPRLTLSYGVRYEWMAPPVEKYGHMSSFVPALDQVVIAGAAGVPNLVALLTSAGLTGRVITASQAGLPQSLVYGNHLDFAPRVGFALRPGGDGKTVLRGGYGIYFANSLLDPIRNDLTNIFPFTVSQTFNRVTSQPAALTLDNPFPAALASLPGVTNTNGFDTNPGAQYVESYTLSADRQLDADTTLEADYVGSRGTHLGQRYDVNQPFRAAVYNGNFPRPYTGFGTINYYGFGANSVYNGGTLMLHRRFRRGFFYGATYTYAKSIDDASQVSGSGSGGYAGAQNSRDLAAERGRSDWDTGHTVSAFGSYLLPWHHPLLSGWSLSATVLAYTGQPFTPQLANANLNLGEASRPDRIVSGKLANPTPNDWFSVAAFLPVPMGAFRFGNSGRNILDGPGSMTLNAALSRAFQFSDRVRAQLRCEAINLPNHPNFGIPVDTVDTKNAGQILSADAGRSLQLGLRVQF